MGAAVRAPERRFITLLAAVVGTTLLLVGCGSNSNTGGSGSSPGITTSAAGTKVTDTEKEYSINLSTMEFKPGVYTFEVQNTGTMPHDLAIAGPGVAQQTSPTVQPGESTQLTVTLQKGTYELWCTIDGHRQLGMDLKIQVT